MEKEFDQLEYIDEYRRKNQTTITVRLNKKNDADIIEYLANISDSKQGHIKNLLREKINRADQQELKSTQ